MDGFERIIQTFVAGAVGAVATSVLIWLLSLAGAFAALGIPLDASGVGIGWFIWRTVRGGLWGLLFLVPLLRARPQWQRGLLFAVGPTLALWLWRYPQEGRGWLGIHSGFGLPLSALLFWLLWGAVAGIVLTRLLAAEEGTGGDEDQEEGGDTR